MKALVIAIVLAVCGGVGSAEPSGYQLPSMSEVPHGAVPPLELQPPPPAADRRPIFVGAGIVLLAALFWWNTRRRARLAEEDHDDG